LVERFDPDLIFATWAYPDSYAAACLADELGKPLVVKVHGSDVNTLTRVPMRGVMMKRAFRTARRIVAVSSHLKQRLGTIGVSPEKIEVILNGVDKTLFHPIDKREARRRLGHELDGRRILFIGNLVRVKGVGYLIEAMRRLPENVYLDIVGAGELKKELRIVADRCGLADRIRIQGERTHQDIPYWLSAADVFCLPSISEGCPNVVLEALACHVPVVASRVGALPDIVTSDACGTLVEPGDPEALAAALNERLQRGAHVTDSSCEDRVLSWEESAQRVFDVLAKALNRDREVAYS
jgi:glycosyltransferase involved in cell wall biosynthesis